MKTILHTLGITEASGDMAIRLNFTDAIEPADLFNPLADVFKLNNAQLRGMGLWLDISRYVYSKNERWDAAFSAWLRAVYPHPALAGCFVYADPECELDSPNSYIAVISQLRTANIRTAATFSHWVLTANIGAVWLGWADCEGIGVYTKWGGDDANEESFVPADVITGFTAIQSATGRNYTTTKWLLLQGFYDAWRGETAINSTPFKNDYQSVINMASGWDIGYFGLSSYSSNITRLKTIGTNPALRDEVAFVNAKALGRLFVYPSRAIVRSGETIQFISSIDGAAWSVTGLDDVEAYPSGLVRSGQQTGATIVRATFAGLYAESEMVVYRES